MVNLVLLLKLHLIRILLYVLPRWLSSLVFHRQECGSTMRTPQALWRAVGSAALGSAALWSTVLTTAEVPTTFPLPEAVGLWLELMRWQTGIERLFHKEEVDLFQLMLRYYLAIFSSIKGVSLRGTLQSFRKRKHLTLTCTCLGFKA